MIIFNEEQAKEATFQYSEGWVIPIKSGNIWYVQEELLAVILENSTLVKEDLDFRELTEAEKKEVGIDE